MFISVIPLLVAMHGRGAKTGLKWSTPERFSPLAALFRDPYFSKPPQKGEQVRSFVVRSNFMSMNGEFNEKQ